MFNLASFSPEKRMWGPRSGVSFTPAMLSYVSTDSQTCTSAPEYNVAASLYSRRSLSHHESKHRHMVHLEFLGKTSQGSKYGQYLKAYTLSG